MADDPALAEHHQLVRRIGCDRGIEGIVGQNRVEKLRQDEGSPAGPAPLDDERMGSGSSHGRLRVRFANNRDTAAWPRE